MSMTADADILTAGLGALERCDWLEASSLLRTAVDAAPPGSRDEATARTAYSEALWWTSVLDHAIAERERAYELWRALCDDHQAAVAALWIGQEWWEGKADRPRAEAWLARAEGLAGEHPAADVAAKCLLFRAALDGGGIEVGRRAVALARSAHDDGLEALSLSCLGMWHVMRGDLGAAVASFDDGMAIVSAGSIPPRVLGGISADLAYAIELWGDTHPFVPWPDTLRRLARDMDRPALMLSAICCGDAFATAELRDAAERELRDAIDTLGRLGHTGRAAIPVARLAELSVLEGRFDEAAALLGPGEYDEATTLVRGRLALERGEPALAATLAQRAVRRLGEESRATTPALELLVAAHVARGDLDAADAAGERLERLAADHPRTPLSGRAALARASVLAARGDRSAAIALLEDALDSLPSTGSLAIHLADAHLHLARLHAADAPDLAADEAQSALVLFAQAGATHRADQAGALLRSLGRRSIAGARGLAGEQALSEREREVLRLLAAGLTNAEIARRLFISTKTAGNHVSSILTKLGLRRRVEAAAYALTRSDH